jgi:hypothetical protein
MAFAASDMIRSYGNRLSGLAAGGGASRLSGKEFCRVGAGGAVNYALVIRSKYFNI